jgi:glyoxylase-like metal-dependent hydrolase (beta-lactamase superfamily II)
MKTWTSGNYQITRVLSLGSNAFLIAAPHGNILVDTGRSSFRRQLLKNIEAADESKRGIDFLILTHSHYDHCQNARYLKETYGAKIVMSSREAIYTESGYTPLPGGTFRFTDVLSSMGSKIGKQQFGYESFNADFLVDEYLDLNPTGFDVYCISTPAHSAGSISIVVGKDTCITGDVLFGVFKDSVLTPFADHADKLTLDWQKLLDTNCQRFLPGHGGEISRDLLQRELEKYRDGKLR